MTTKQAIAKAKLHDLAKKGKKSLPIADSLSLVSSWTIGTSNTTHAALTRLDRYLNKEGR